MHEIRLEPVGGYKQGPLKRARNQINCLRRWVIVLATADIIYTAIAIMMIAHRVMK